MTNKKQKLELTWIGKENRPRLEPRILLEDPTLSYHAQQRITDQDIFDNRLIFGDNLLALKALEQEFTGKIKCVFIDPPYNTGSAFEQYDDGIEHSLWLSLMRDRVEILRNLLSEDGSIWITLDDNEAHYMKVMCDEVFGRSNFIADVVWEKSDSPRMDARFFSYRHDHLLVYSKNVEKLVLKKIDDNELPAHYDKVDEFGRRYYLKPLRAMGQADSRADRPTLYFPLTAPDGSTVYPLRQDGSDGRWRWSQDRVISEGDRIEWTKGRSGWTPYFRIYGDTGEGRPPETIWTHQEVGSNRTSKAEIKAIFSDAKAFDTPKPEKLLERIVYLSTNEGDIVLDSFAGSGTTGAVAHKMKRRWIMVELGEHCQTLIIPRMRKVIDGEDPGGITQSNNWKGGGGFRFFRLAPSLLEKDRWGNWVINRQYKPAMLAEAVCKLEGFTYAPSDIHYWQHGFSTEKDFIFVTTQTLTHEQLLSISDDVGSDNTLLIMCSAYRSSNEASYTNLTIKKIPQAVLSRCEYGHDDYSLQVANLPISKPRPENGAEKGVKTQNRTQQIGFDFEGGK